MLVRPTGDIGSLPAPGWTPTPLFERLDETSPDDSDFITGLAAGAQDPQVAVNIGALDIPHGSTARIIVRVRMRWDGTLTETPDAVRIGIGDAADLGVDNPSFGPGQVREVIGFSNTEFETVEIAFDFTDVAFDDANLGVYVEMTPASADAARSGQISWIEVEGCTPAVLVGRCQLGSLTAGDIIDQARDFNSGFEKREFPGKMLLRYLSRYQRTLVAMIAEKNSALLAVETLVTLPLPDFDGGILLPSIVYVLPGVGVRTTSGQIWDIIELVNLTLMDDPETAAQTVILRGKFLLLSGQERDWQRYDQLRLQMVTEPKNLTSLASPLVFPDYAEDALVTGVASFMGGRMGVDLTAQAGGAQKLFLETVASERRAEVFATRDVFPG